MATLNKNEEVLCHVCGTFSVACCNHNCYDQHVQTVNQLIDFFTAIEEDFIILVNRLRLEHNALVININFFALYHEESLNEDSKYIAEVKMFNVYNKELAKNTDVYKLYKDIVHSFIFQSDGLKTSKCSWTLEELLFVEIIKVKKLFEMNLHQNHL
ncbi:uncharacterized protein LOC132945468 isoform X2 [Metopolophium dirhodum]|uniref:uncharacterized protein LOC132945468 isoform X2 n=1 Tax=Metopolophium dirhodum TaxID=44670 RepID=UPI0029907419|nr:uncharacterized protein LOC132945468 isoform X2 [Metopolophium dirhodum]